VDIDNTNSMVLEDVECDNKKWLLKTGREKVKKFAEQIALLTKCRDYKEKNTSHKIMRSKPWDVTSTSQYVQHECTL